VFPERLFAGIPKICINKVAEINKDLVSTWIDVLMWLQLCCLFSRQGPLGFSSMQDGTAATVPVN